MEVGAIAQPFDPAWGTPGYNTLALVVGCVDNAKARQSIAKVLETNNQRLAPHTWYLDCGDSRQSGQILLGSHPSTQPDDYQFDPFGCFRLPAPTSRSYRS